MTVDEIIKLMADEEKQEEYIKNHKAEIESRPFRLLVGDRAYKDANDRVIYNKIPYRDFSGEVAFLSNNYKATMFLVVSILLKSHDDAKNLIVKMKKQRISMLKFAEILYKIFHIVLINRNESDGKKRDYHKIMNIITLYGIKKVLFLGCNDSKTSKMLIRELDQSEIAYEQILHPSPHGYSFDPTLWTQLYLHHEDKTLVKVKFVDFQI